MYAHFDRFTIQMTREQAEIGSHPGPCDSDVEYLLTLPAIKRQAKKLDPLMVAAELLEYGAWDIDELADNDANLRRIFWIAAGNITHPDG